VKIQKKENRPAPRQKPMLFWFYSCIMSKSPKLLISGVLGSNPARGTPLIIKRPLKPIRKFINYNKREYIMKKTIIFLAITIVFCLSLNSAIAKGGKGGGGGSSRGGSSKSARSSKPSTRKSAQPKSIKYDKPQKANKPKTARKTPTPKSQKNAKIIPVKEIKGKPEKNKDKKIKKAPQQGKKKTATDKDADQGKNKGKGKNKDKVKGQEKAKEKKREKNEKGKAKGKGKAQQRKAVEKQIAHETDKHKTRAARFERLRELAKGDEKTLARIDKLANREQQRFGTKIQKLEKRKLSPEQPDADNMPKNKGKGKDKDKDKPEKKDKSKDSNEDNE
jgi:hypothetical protein